MFASLSAIKLYIALGLLVASFIGGASVMHHWDSVAILKLKDAYAEAVVEAQKKAAEEQARLDAIDLKEAQEEAQAQSDITARTQKQLEESKKHVKVVSCLPIGVVRVLYAASHNRLPDSLTIRSGKSDGACAPSGWLGLVQGIVRDYGTAQGNAEQLNRWIEWYKATHR